MLTVTDFSYAFFVVAFISALSLFSHLKLAPDAGSDDQTTPSDEAESGTESRFKVTARSTGCTAGPIRAPEADTRCRCDC